MEQELWEAASLQFGEVPDDKMAASLKGYWPNKLSFSESRELVMRMLMTLHGASPGGILVLLQDLENMENLVKLLARRERAYQRGVKEMPWKYPQAKKKNSQSVA